jgi:hypothetical protein
MFKNYCIAQGVRRRKFGLDMDVRWNATYLMLKHLLPYKDVFSVFINSNYGSSLLTARHWYIAGKILDFLKNFMNPQLFFLLLDLPLPLPPLHLYLLLLLLVNYQLI